jgi:photosystem II stability/assembly factor-like uncharacterized protein
MKHCTLALLSFLFVFQTLHSQNIEALFSREGLSVNGYHYNYYDGTYSTSHTFVDKITICDDLEVLRFLPHDGVGIPLYLHVDGLKVYKIFHSCSPQLVYDFGLEINETVTEGIYEGYTLVEKYTVTLLNGEERMRYDLESSFGAEASWIEGIGDIKNALIHAYYDFEGYDQFVCAKEGDQLLWLDEEEGELCDAYSCPKPVVIIEPEVNDLTLNIANNTFFGTDYVWDFGDGNTSEDAIPTYQYSEPGCYALNVQVSNECYEGNNTFISNIPICIGDAWITDYEFETFHTLYVRRYSDDLEFIYDRIGPKLHKTTDGGQSFSPVPLPTLPSNISRRIFDIKMFDEQRGVMICGHYGASSEQKAIFVTTDGGDSWEEKVPESYFMLTLEVTSDGRAWATGSSRRYYRSFDYGETWEQIEYPDLFSVRDIQYVNDNLLVATGYKGIAPWGKYYLTKSYDNGATWDTLNFPAGLSSWHFFNENLAYARGVNGLFAISDDGGVSWSQSDLGFFVADFSFFDPDHGWISDYTGLIHYTNNGLESFRTTNCSREKGLGLTAISQTEAFMVSSRAHGASNIDDSRKHFDMDAMTIGCITDADEDGYTVDEDCDDDNPDINPDATEIPNNGIDEDCDGSDLTTGFSESEMANIQIYPNPFNDQFMIELSDQVREIRVVNILGHQIYNQTIRGEQNLQINLSDFPSGTYTLQLYTKEGNTYSTSLLKI